MSTPQPARRRRGLLDPNDLRASHVRSQGSVEGLDHVRQWVLSILLVSTILHLAAGLALMGIHLLHLWQGQGRPGDWLALALGLALLGVALRDLFQAIWRYGPFGLNLGPARNDPLG